MTDQEHYDAILKAQRELGANTMTKEQREKADYDAILNAYQAHDLQEGPQYRRISDVANADPAAVLNRIIGLQRRIEVLEAALRIRNDDPPKSEELSATGQFLADWPSR